jgi:hypothetical protein
MAQKIYSEAHGLIPMVSPRIVSHVATLVQPENLIDKCRQSSSTLGGILWNVRTGVIGAQLKFRGPHETCPRNPHETPKLRPRNSVPETP